MALSRCLHHELLHVGLNLTHTIVSTIDARFLDSQSPDTLTMTGATPFLPSTSPDNYSASTIFIPPTLFPIVATADPVTSPTATSLTPLVPSTLPTTTSPTSPEPPAGTATSPGLDMAPSSTHVPVSSQIAASFDNVTGSPARSTVTPSSHSPSSGTESTAPLSALSQPVLGSVAGDLSTSPSSPGVGSTESSVASSPDATSTSTSSGRAGRNRVPVVSLAILAATLAGTIWR
ncbi:hypothetical protein OF83DRAFT_149487 [Amylostereum chailletii]|nr:hypothetical protein OF83DRAFT_149487 [Amylostereum chailletii]